MHTCVAWFQLTARGTELSHHTNPCFRKTLVQCCTALHHTGVISFLATQWKPFHCMSCFFKKVRWFLNSKSLPLIFCQNPALGCVFMRVCARRSGGACSRGASWAQRPPYDSTSSGSAGLSMSLTQGATRRAIKSCGGFWRRPQGFACPGMGSWMVDRLIVSIVIALTEGCTFMLLIGMLHPTLLPRERRTHCSSPSDGEDGPALYLWLNNGRRMVSQTIHLSGSAGRSLAVHLRETDIGVIWTSIWHVSFPLSRISRGTKSPSSLCGVSVTFCCDLL